MAANNKGSLDIVNRAAENRELTRDFLLDAFQLQLDNSNLTEGLNRYYRIKINSLLETNQNNLDYILKLSENNLNRCIKCGSAKRIRLRSRRSKNKSPTRKYCRYLKSLCDFVCDTCHHCKTFKLSSRKALKNQAKTESLAKVITKHIIAIPEIKKPPPAQTNKPISSKRTHSLKSSKQKQPIVTKPKQAPSSRLRAFSCLLKE